MKKVISLILIITLTILTLSLTSCNRKYDENEILTVSEALIKKSEKLNELYFGKGLDYVDDESTASGSYYRASDESLDYYGIESIEDLRVLTLSVYTREYAGILFETRLGNFESDSEISYTRYYQAYGIDGEPTYLMVYIYFYRLMRSSIEFKYETLRVVGSKGDTVYVEIEVLVTNEDGDKTQTQTLTVPLIEESDGWKLDDCTFVNYSEYLDNQN